MCHEVVDMAQRVRESVFVRISRRLRSMRHYGAFAALCVLLVAAVAGLAVAGTTLASGESFTIERLQRAERAVVPGQDRWSLWRQTCWGDRVGRCRVG